MNVEAHDAVVTGHDGTLVLWILLGLAGVAALVAVARRRDPELPPSVPPLVGAVIAGAVLAIAVPHANAPFVSAALLSAAALGWVLVAGARPRLARTPALLLGALVVWEVATTALFALELPIQTVLNTRLGKGGGLLYYGVFWSLQGAAALVAYATRRRWLAGARRHPMLFGGALLVVLASLDGYTAVFRAIAIAAVFVAISFRDVSWKWPKLLGALAFLGLLLAWMFTWDHRFFGFDIRRFNRPLLAGANVVLVSAYLWRKQPRLPLAVCGALLALAPFLLRLVDADNLFRVLLGLNVAYFVAVARSSAQDKAGLAQLAIVSFYLLFCWDREFQVLMLLASLAVLELAFASRRFEGDASHAICLAIGVGVYAFRLVEFAIFEQWFSFSSVEVTSGFLGNKSLNIYWAVTAIFLKFMAPFLLVLSVACRRLNERAIGRVSIVVLSVIALRLCHISLWFMLTARQAYAGYHLVPEFFFLSMFLLTYCLAAGIYVLVRRPVLPDAQLEVAPA
jgi:hypothetical protein